MLRTIEIHYEAKNSLQGKWSNFAIITFALLIVYFIVITPVLIANNISVIAQVKGVEEPHLLLVGLHLAYIILLMPYIVIYWGYNIIYLNNLRGESVSVEHIFNGFRDFRRICGTRLLEAIYVALWILLFAIPISILSVMTLTQVITNEAVFKLVVNLIVILCCIPGIIKAYSYSLTQYILKDYPQLSYNAAIEKSMQIMKGRKLRLFKLHVSFFGWFMLSMCTLGIGLLWLIPYISTSQAVFYLEAKAESENTYYEDTPQ